MEQPKIQKGVFIFMRNQGHDIHGMYHMLTIYAETIGEKKPKKNKLKWYSDISNKIQDDFANFKKLYNKHKRDIPTVQFQSYEDWWEENNLDGGFAYNGVTDDF